jgi:hypothetical protein
VSQYEGVSELGVLGRVPLFFFFFFNENKKERSPRFRLGRGTLEETPKVPVIVFVAFFI